MLGDRLGDFVNLAGCFIGYNNYPELDNNIFLLFLTSESKIFKNFLDRLTYHSNYKDRLNVESTHEIYIFNVPEEQQKNYTYFKQSKYSLLDENYKKHILKFHNYNKYEEGNTVYKILYKDESLYVDKENELNKGLPESSWIRIPRDIEIGNQLKDEDEIFRNSLIKELVH